MKFKVFAVIIAIAFICTGKASAQYFGVGLNGTLRVSSHFGLFGEARC